MEQFDLALYASTSLAALGIRHALAGSLASMSYGEAHLTRDIDFVVDLADAQVEPLCERFPRPDYYVSAMLLTTPSGFAVSSTSFTFRRATKST